jgi:hypothetical protein
MMEKRNNWVWIAAILLCTTLGASFATVYFYSQSDYYKRNYESLAGELNNLTIRVNLKIDYGNGTVRWYNGTRVPLEATLLIATKTVLKIEYTLSDFGAFVNTINGVSGDMSHFWLWSYFDKRQGSWAPGLVGSDKWILHNEDVVAWTFSTF